MVVPCIRPPLVPYKPLKKDIMWEDMASRVLWDNPVPTFGVGCNIGIYGDMQGRGM